MVILSPLLVVQHTILLNCTVVLPWIFKNDVVPPVLHQEKKELCSAPTVRLRNSLSLVWFGSGLGQVWIRYGPGTSLIKDHKLVKYTIFQINGSVEQIIHHNVLVHLVKVTARRASTNITKIKVENQTNSKKKKTIQIKTVNQLVHMVQGDKRVEKVQTNTRKINIKNNQFSIKKLSEKSCVL